MTTAAPPQRPSASQAAGQLTDSWGRVLNYLRISVTDRCNFRCTYCMPAAGVELVPREDILSFEEIVRVVEAGAALGLHKVRLTGGEPTLRRDLPQLVRLLRGVEGVREVAMTTNASLLDLLAEPLAQAGLTRLNISLDATDPAISEEIARRNVAPAVTRGIEAAIAARLPVKFNTVVLPGVNEGQLRDLVRYAHGLNCPIRFIEYMPMGATGRSAAGGSLTSAQVRQLLEPEFLLEPEATSDSSDPARPWVCSRTGARVGFISSLSENFCSSCTRMRLTATGGLRPCLHQDAEVDLRSLLRHGADTLRLQQAFAEAAALKWEGHGMKDFVPLLSVKDMVSIGG